MNRQTLVIIGLIGVIALLLWFRGCEAKNYKEEIALLKASNDTLTKTRNKDGTETTKISLLQASNTKMFLQLQTNDKTIKQLQEVVKANKSKLKDGGSATIIENVTTFTNTIANDSINLRSDSCNPTYYSTNKDTIWIKYSIIANKDSTSFKLIVKNAYTVIIGSERVSLFKRKPIVEIINKNLYTETTSLRALEVKDTRNHRVSLGAQFGYGLVITGIGQNKPVLVNPGGYIGIGLNIKIF